MDVCVLTLCIIAAILLQGCTWNERGAGAGDTFSLDYSTPCDPELQAALARIHTALRNRYGIGPDQAAAGVIDLRRRELALIEPDRLFYGASVPKIGILLTYFETHPESARQLAPETRRELGLMIKKSSNELAAKYSLQLGLGQIRAVLEKYGLYDATRGGGIWVGKHYGVTGERIGDPVGDHSHSSTIRQMLRFCLLLEQGKLVSPEASLRMREIFASPDITHEDNKFVKGLQDRDVEVLRKSGSWEEWLHDLAIVKGGGRHYILAALTKHPAGDEYLTDLAEAIDTELSCRAQ